MLRKFLLGSIAALGVVGVSAVAQQWLPFPIVGGSSFCSSTVNNTCVNTVPAGPALSGNESIPADTNAANGQSPQTVKIPVTALGVGTLDYSAPTSGTLITANSTTRQIIVKPAGTLAALSLILPAASVLTNGQRIGFCTTQIITAMTVYAGTGTTVSNAPTAMLVPVATGAASCVEWIYRQADTTWYRVQ